MNLWVYLVSVFKIQQFDLKTRLLRTYFNRIILKNVYLKTLIAAFKFKDIILERNENDFV